MASGVLVLAALATSHAWAADSAGGALYADPTVVEFAQSLGADEDTVGQVYHDLHVRHVVRGDGGDGSARAWIEVGVRESHPAVFTFGTPEDPIDDGPPELSEGLWDALAAAIDGDVVELDLTVRRSVWTPGAPWTTERDRAILLGEVQSPEEIRTRRAEWIGARREAAWGAVEPILTELAEAGITLVEFDDFNAVISIEARTDAIEWLLEDARFAFVGPPPSVSADGLLYPPLDDVTDGIELSDELQSDQFYTDGITGVGTIALLEGGADNVFIEHPGFYDGASTNRARNCVTNSFGVCTSFPSPTIGATHPTAVASVAVGDITLGQDSEISDTSERAARSGVARSAELIGIGIGVGDPSVGDILAVLSETNSVDYINASYGEYLDDEHCRGNSTSAHKYNGFFEANIPVFKSAGNEGHGNPEDCTVSDPASAMGVFPVAAWYPNDATAPDNIYDHSSLGGVSLAEGRERTIVGAAAPSNQSFAFPSYDRPRGPLSYNRLVGVRYGPDWIIDATDYNPAPDDRFGQIAADARLGRTSGAAPVATGAAALLQAWSNDTWSVDLDAGELYALMLLMGDRTCVAGGIGDPCGPLGLPLTVGYDPLWGAGKLRLRALDEAGLDDPYAADWGSVCVDQNDNVVIAELDDMPSGVDVLKIVLWWYDDRHDSTSGSSHDKVDLYLWDNPFMPFATDESNDNKKRLFQTGMTGGEDYVITAVGRSVTSDTSGCGTNSMRVFYAWFYESSAREAAEGLADVRTEDG